MHGLWIAGLGFQALLALALARENRWKKFPAFTAYIVFNLLEAAVGYASVHNHGAYLYVYIIGETVAVALGLAVVYEIFTHLLHPYPALRKLAALVFRIVAVLLAVLAGAVIYGRAPFHERDVLTALLVVEEAARILEVGLVMFLFLFSSVFGLHWRQPVFGIALGLGVFVAVKLAEVTLLPHAGSAAEALNLTGMLTFDLSLLVWLGYTLAPERVTSVAELPQRAQLEQWNQAIMELVNQ
jgi:hypothetical protein